MFFYTVADGERVIMVNKDGSTEIIVGPARVFKRGREFTRMNHHVAHPGEFLIVRFRDGRQEHHTGPTHVWFDPREHHSVVREESLQIAAKEAVVVYAKDDGGEVARRIEHGPATFMPQPGEWLHTFSWHGTAGDGYRKVPNALVFQKLWLLADQLYHDVTDVRTGDDAVLTIRLMLFFELTDIETMLATTHDPIGDFLNAATSDVIDFIGRRDFEGFKSETNKLNDLATYKQLVSRAEACGYRIDKVVFRGYGAPATLQEMHDQAIESRTRLQLERANEEQAQSLEDFKLQHQLVRDKRHREEAAKKLDHDIDIARKSQEAELAADSTKREHQRAQLQRDDAQRNEEIAARGGVQREHFAALKKLGVDLTELLTNGKPDHILEVRGGGSPHVHLDGRHEPKSALKKPAK